MVPWVGSGVCKNEKIYSSEKFITTDGLKSSSAKLFLEGTTFVALVGATIGKTALACLKPILIRTLFKSTEII